MQKYLNLSDQGQLDATYDFWVTRMMPSVPKVSTDNFALAVERCMVERPR